MRLFIISVGVVVFSVAAMRGQSFPEGIGIADDGGNAPLVHQPAYRIEPTWGNLMTLVGYADQPTHSRFLVYQGINPYNAWCERVNRRIADVGLRYLDQVDRDSESGRDRNYWLAAEWILQYQPSFIRFENGTPDKINEDERDERAAWRKRRSALCDTILKTEESDIHARDLAAMSVFRERILDKNDKRSPELLVPCALEFAEKYPNCEMLGHDIVRKLNTYQKEHGDMTSPDPWDKFVNCPHQIVRETAIAKVILSRLGHSPMQMSFTAVDGRAVDLQQLQGKVVVITFWDLGCAPCIADIPYIKQAYDELHSAGLEIVGVDMDGAKSNKDGRLLKFYAENGMSWPQHFDGKGWKNEWATKFGITSTPTYIFLDRAGKIVSIRNGGLKDEWLRYSRALLSK